MLSVVRVIIILDRWEWIDSGLNNLRARMELLENLGSRIEEQLFYFLQFHFHPYLFFPLIFAFY